LQPNSGNICDVYDGLQYKKWKNFLNEPANVSFLVNTDGVAIFRSSKFSIWPVWIVINELPKSQRYVLFMYILYHNYNYVFRFLRKNMLLAGVWYSKDKPTMTTFLKPIIEEINELYVHGNA
jgi:hypothetical protein